MQLSNLKAILFFVTILPQFIDRTRPIVLQLVVLGVTSIVLEFGVLAAYAATAAQASRVAIESRRAPLANRFSGALLIGAALRLFHLER